ncbi:MAG TPA: benzoyl-CoA reductase subunit C [Candidatus Kapabacteria bacterium]|nr:benzoyl-CoA reductase subunit C [Candidatus Kapabacteria bacterium]
MARSIETIVAQCQEVAFDLRYGRALAWKREAEGRFIVGHLPMYVPREIVHALGGLPVEILGTGDRMQIIKGDAYFQSYICHLPRGVIELLTSGALDEFDAFLFPSICDVIRNLSGMFQLLRPGRFVKYLDFPQNFSPSVGGAFYRRELESIIDGIRAATGATFSPDALAHSIGLFNRNRELIERIVTLRADYPWRLSAVELYTVVCAGLAMPVEEHNAILGEVLDGMDEERGVALDNVRVVVSGAFCEQPPIGLIRTIEMAGCYIVDDDFLVGSRWIDGPIATDTGDPVGALVDAYLERSTFSSSVYDAGNPKSARLIDLVRRRRADGVIFAAPGFCDPALLDRPAMQNALDAAAIRTIAFQYTENTGQFKVIKEQVGAFSDSIKLWDEPALQETP